MRGCSVLWGGRELQKRGFQRKCIVTLVFRVRYGMVIVVSGSRFWFLFSMFVLVYLVVGLVGFLDSQRFGFREFSFKVQQELAVVEEYLQVVFFQRDQVLVEAQVRQSKQFSQVQLGARSGRVSILVFRRFVRSVQEVYFYQGFFLGILFLKSRRVVYGVFICYVRLYLFILFCR